MEDIRALDDNTGSHSLMSHSFISPTADLSQATCIAGLCGCEIESEVRSDESREPLNCVQPPDMLCAVR